MSFGYLYPLTQEPYVGEDRLGRTLTVAEVDRLAVVSLAIFVEIDQQLEYILLTGRAGITQLRFIVAVDRIHVRTDNGNGYVVSKIVHVSAINIQSLSLSLCGRCGFFMGDFWV